MNELLFFSMIIIFFTNCIGLSIAIEFLLENRTVQYIYLTFGWFFWTIAILSSILDGYIETEFFSQILLLVSSDASLVGTFLIITGIFSYFTIIKNSFVILGVVFQLVLILPIYLIFDYEITIEIIDILSIIIYFVSVIIVIKYILQRNSNSSKSQFKLPRTLYTIVIIGIVFIVSLALFSITGETAGLYRSEDSITIIINNSTFILETFLTIIIMIHIEYYMLNEKKEKLIDKFSHDLGNIMQVITGKVLILKENQPLNESTEISLDLLETKTFEASELIKEIRKL